MFDIQTPSEYPLPGAGAPKCTLRFKSGSGRIRCQSNYWGSSRGRSFFQNPVHRAFSERFVPERSADDRIARLKQGKYAMLTKCIYEKHFMESEMVPAALLNDLRTGRACANQFYIGLGFVKRSPYTKPADLVIQRIFESGLIDYWLSRVTEVRMPPATFKQVYEIKPHNTAAQSIPSPLSFRQFKVIVVVWMAGCAISTLVLVTERQYYARNTNNNNCFPSPASLGRASCSR